MQIQLQDNIALVTGASRGIGRAIASELAKAGATVIGTATTEAGADAITQMLKQHGAGCGLKLDVSQPDSINTVLKKIEQDFATPTILVNNAGITRDNLLLRMSDDDWDQVLNTNLSSIFRLSKAVMRGMMKKRNGRIINITSVTAVMGNAGQSNYAAAKAGMIGFTKALARELGSRNITVNAVAPGFIDTDMTKDLNESQRAAMLDGVPLKRMGEVQDIAHAVVFLASEYASYISGETLHVNGGLYMN